MTISGEFTKTQLLVRRLQNALPCLILSGGGLWFAYHLVQKTREHFSPDQFTQIASMAFFPFVGLVAYLLLTWSDRWRIVAFTCDEHSFRFRKLRDPYQETRDVSEVAKVEEVRGRYNELCGYQLGFRDGSQAYLGLRLPNAQTLADFLYIHRHPAPPGSSGLARFIKAVFGKVEFVPLPSLQTEQRVCQRYRAEIAELSGFGFEYCSCFGEAFSAVRLLFLIPALVVVLLLLSRRPFRIYQGVKIMSCYPLLISRDKATYANPSENGVKLYTAFTDGTFLVTATGAVEESDGSTMTKFGGASSIPQVFALHEKRLRTFESTGKRVDRSACFSNFAGLWEKESALF